MPGISENERHRAWRIWARPEGLDQNRPHRRRKCSKVEEHFLVMFSYLPTILHPTQLRVLILNRPLSGNPTNACTVLAERH